MNYTKDFNNIMKMPGVYIIKNDATDKVYIGSSNNIYDRIKTHFSQLRLNKHFNDHLQFSYNKYGESVFSFKILAILENSELLIVEQRLLDFYQSYNRKFGYNISKTASGVCMAGELNGFYGKQHSKETLKILQENSRKMFGSREIVCEQTNQVFVGVKEASRALNIPWHCITKFLLGKQKALLCGYTFKYLYETDQDIKIKNENLSKYNRVNVFMKILCENDGKIFSTCVEASKYYKISAKKIRRSVHNNKHTKSGLKFVLLEKQVHKYHRKVICLNNQKIYKSIKDAGEDLGIKYYKNIRMAIARDGTCCGYKFKYVENCKCQ